MEFHYSYRNDTAKLTVNYVVKQLELYTSDSGHYCLDIHTFIKMRMYIVFSQNPFKIRKSKSY